MISISSFLLIQHSIPLKDYFQQVIRDRLIAFFVLCIQIESHITVKQETCEGSGNALLLLKIMRNGSESFYSAHDIDK